VQEKRCSGLRGQGGGRSGCTRGRACALLLPPLCLRQKVQQAGQGLLLLRRAAQRCHEGARKGGRARRHAQHQQRQHAQGQRRVR
jgi:hypothetical protein